MFKYSIPLKFSDHADLRILESNDYSFARNVLLAPILYAEMGDAAREYPIVFPDNKSDLPHVLLGLEAGQNAYVAPDGRWLATYVPASIRQYPFALKGAKPVEGEKERRFALLFDPQAPQIGKTHGHPIFTDAGKLSPQMEARVKLLRQIETEAPPTRRTVVALRDSGVLIERKITIREAGKARTITGMRVVDERALSQLPDEAFNRLRREGALPLAYSHLISWANFRQGAIAGKYPELAKPAAASAFDFSSGTLSFSTLS